MGKSDGANINNRVQRQSIMVRGATNQRGGNRSYYCTGHARTRGK